MPRYHLVIEYDGTPYVGWQRQDNGMSVQEVVETAGQALSGALAPVYGAGRTDAGVHALGMSAHIDLNKDYPADTVKSALNAHMRPHPVAILEARAVDDKFHARFGATARHYRYIILNRRAPPALSANRVWTIGPSLDIEAMNTAAQAFVGRHDFTTFRSSQCQAKSPIKSLSSICVSANGDSIFTDISAPSFLHNQVRSLVGTLVQVGLGRWQPDYVADAIAAKDRSRCGPVAPANGLYFVKAVY